MSTNNTSNDDFIQIDYTGKQINDAIRDVINVLPNKADSSSVHSIPSGGTIGQVLKKTSDSDYQVAWQDDSGGGSGTSNYSNLTNKPKINNVELSGNKTTSDLGLFSGAYDELSGKPTIPTVDQTYDGTSANAQSGVAVASAISGKEDTSDKVTSLSAQSTDTEYPSAKCVYDNLITKQTAPHYELIEKVVIGYSITTQEPADWSTNYTDYFTNTGTAREPVYTAVTGESAPTWQSGTYYSYQSGGVQMLDVYKEPDGTDYSFKHLYLTFEQGGSSNINGAFFFATALYNLISEHYGGFVTQMNASTSQKHIIRVGINGNLGYYFNWWGAYNRMSDYSDQPILSTQETAITGWRLRRAMGGILLSGTTIYVYGVR